MGPETSVAGSRTNGQAPELASFFYDLSPTAFHHFWNADGVYVRAQEEVLGDETSSEEADKKPELLDHSRCFNCGDPDHKITECHHRLDRDLITLSRQYYQFFQGTLGLGNWQRVHTAEAWRQQRLSWLEEFEPGEIRGELLKDALRSSNDELLRNISAWGYPPGWLSEVDPRERVRDRIWNENDGDVDVELEQAQPFEIHGEDHIETISFRDVFRLGEYPSYSRDTLPNGSESRSNSPTDTESASTIDYKDSTPATLRRWANYPLDYFASQHLIPYQPPPPPTPWFSFKNTSSYLAYYDPQPFAPMSTPPPPLEEPPPLPPSTPHPPPPSAPPPLPTIIFPLPPPTYPTIASPMSNQRTSLIANLDQAELSECDMDFSDPE